MHRRQSKQGFGSLQEGRAFHRHALDEAAPELPPADQSPYLSDPLLLASAQQGLLALTQFSHARGALWQLYGKKAPANAGFGWAADGVFDHITPNCAAGFANCPSAIELTQAWSVNAAYQHRWSLMWQTSVYGGYVDVSYNNAAKTIINSHLPGAGGSIQCGVAVAGSVWPAITMTGGGAGNSCTPNFSFFQVGTRTEFTPVHGFGLGLDVFYTHLNTAYKGVGTYAANGTRPATAFVDDQNVLSAIFRVQRNISGED